MKHLEREAAKAHAKPAVHADAIDKAIAALRAAIGQVPGLVAMTPMERKRTIRIHTGGERYIEQMATLAENRKDLCPRGVDAASMHARLAVAQRLAELAAELTRALQTVDDSHMAATSTAWHDALDIYAVASTASRREPELAAQIAGMEGFLATGPRQPRVRKTPAA
jgi:hypothetical protein